MHKPNGLSRRSLLQSAAASSLVFAAPARAAAPEPVSITPALIEAAKKEGKVSFYTAVDLQVAERIAKSFEARYPGVSVRVERAGSERVFQRIGQEYTARIYAADIINTTDSAHFIIWKN